MNSRYPAIHPRCKRILHGGDYNPEQWLRTPGILDEDMRLMKLAGYNVVSLGIFAWSALEPEEGRFEFGWLDDMMDKLAANGVLVVLATPSGSKPAWLSRAYPEVCKVGADGRREPHGGRHNHCRTSPVYRAKCRLINTRLAERYGKHPSLALWHASNEYNGIDCHCELCHAAFQEWLKARYGHDIDKLNHAYWSAFWSHTFSDWRDVRPLDTGLHGLMLDWERFKTAQTIDFFRDETAPLRAITPDIPVTTNFMPGWGTLDYCEFAKAVDVVAWDSYPAWHETGDDPAVAAGTAFLHDMCRAMKPGRPFLLMESTPSIATRGAIKKRKQPGMHWLSSLQAVAHGSDTVMYFQWRKGRGCCEKFHGAVVDHAGHEGTREFREVAEVGQLLPRLDAVVGMPAVKAEVALVFDFENEWALDSGARVFLGNNVNYRGDCEAHYRPFWEAGVPVDVIDQTASLDGYRLAVVPMAYMLRPGFAQRLRQFVEAGGTAVMTCWSAVVDETDLCYLGGVPGAGLREVFGVWEEETQAYFPHESVRLRMRKGNALGMQGVYKATDLCSVIHAEGATVLASYVTDYFAGTPAVTVNRFGKGRAYYLASRNEARFLSRFYGAIQRDLALSPVIRATLPPGVTAQAREAGRERIVFLMNFNNRAKRVRLATPYTDLLDRKRVNGTLTLDPYAVRFLCVPVGGVVDL